MSIRSLLHILLSPITSLSQRIKFFNWRNRRDTQASRRRDPLSIQAEFLEVRAFLSVTAATAITVHATSAVENSGQEDTFTATVKSTSGTPNEGSVAFNDGATTLGTANVTNGTAVFTTTTPLALGLHVITATYTDTGGNYLNSSTGLSSTSIINTVAGSGAVGFGGDGSLATSASVKLNFPNAVAVDVAGDLFIADNGNDRIREVNASTGIITTVAGTGATGYTGDGHAATNATLNNPTGIAVDAAGDIFIADEGNHVVREVNAATGVITTVAGTGVAGYSGDGNAATSAMLYNDESVAVDAQGDLFITDYYQGQSARIREVNASTGTISTVAGGGSNGIGTNPGVATAAIIPNANAIAIDATGDLFVVDPVSRLVDEITVSNGISPRMIERVAGGSSNVTYTYGNYAQTSARAATSAALDHPNGVLVDPAGDIFVSDAGYNIVSWVNGTSKNIGVFAGKSSLNSSAGFAGDGTAITNSVLNEPTGVAIDPAGDVFIVDAANKRIREVTSGNASVAVVAVAPVITAPTSVTVSQNGTVAFTVANAISITDTSGTAEQLTLSVQHGSLTLGTTSGLTVTGNGTGSVTLSGPLSSLNTGLASLSYTAAPGYNGSDTLSLSDLDTTDNLTGTANVTIAFLPPSQTWTQMSNSVPGDYSQMSLLLPNGDLMVHGAIGLSSGASSNWYLVTPDSTGNYQNGTWTKIASMNQKRLYFGADVLPNGNVFVVGGEYASDGTYAGQNGVTLSNSAEIYNPTTNVWTSVASDPQPYVGDEPTAVLPNGNVLVGNIFNNGTEIYNPTTNTWSAGGAKIRANERSDEESWVKLPNGDILAYDLFSSIASGTGQAELYNPSTNSWSDASTGTLPVLSSSAAGYEMGADVMLPNGNALFTGANGLTAYYNVAAGTWSQGPTMPSVAINSVQTQLTMGDAPAAVLPNGDVLMALSPAVNNGSFPPPTDIYDFNPIDGVYTNVTPSSNVFTQLSSINSYGTSMLVLPNGQVMLNNYTQQPVLYTLSGTSASSWRPQITGFVANGNGSFTLTGTQLNGLDEGAAYGDDEQMASNYPIVQVTDTKTGQVYYATTSNWSSNWVATGATPETVTVTLPTALGSDPFTVTAIANGIASTTFSLVVPAITAPSTASVSVGSSFSFTSPNGISVTDAGGTAEQITLSVQHGVLTLGSTAGLTFTGNNSSSLTLTGSLSSLNSDLATLSYTPTSKYSGPDLLSISDTDTATNQTATANVTITVNLVLNQPSVTNATTTDNTQTTSGLVITPNALDTGFVTNFQITGITGGTLYLNDGTTPVTNGQFITLAQGAAGLTFTPATNSVASGSFTVQESTTSTAAGLGGPTATATITVNLVLNQPVVTNATTTDNTQTTSGLVITPNGLDTGFVTNFQITGITVGTLYLNDGTTPVTNGQFITLAQGAAGLTFTPATNSVAPGSFTVQESTTATAAGLGGPTGTATITVNAGAATQLVFQAVGGGKASGYLSPVKVAVEDQYGNVVTGDTSPVTMSVASGPGGFASASTISVAAVNGIATFTGLILRTSGTYTLSASDGTLVGGTSGSIVVVPGAASKLVIGDPQNLPASSTVTAGTVISPVVLVEDNYGNVVLDNSTQVSMTFGGVNLGTQLAVNGVATFAPQTLTVVGTKNVNASLVSSSLPLSNATTVSFVVTPAAASKLVITQSPSTGTAGAVLGPVKVAVEDSFGNLLTGDSSTVALSIGSGPGALTAGSTTSVAAVNGIATFSNLLLNTSGTYTLSVSDGALSGATSGNLVVKSGTAS